MSFALNMYPGSSFFGEGIVILSHDSTSVVDCFSRLTLLALYTVTYREPIWVFVETAKSFELRWLSTNTALEKFQFQSGNSKRLPVSIPSKAHSHQVLFPVSGSLRIDAERLIVAGSVKVP